ncbi:MULTISPECIES: response regulator transcription factor [Stenotrophomonas]|uniref:DNA-binding response regulator n=1 Tax=Stenotrophomonas pavanii TaxID=487698 RepID=A0A246KUF6_9GAMM|nr:MULTISPECIES: response regulator transcription factor [Stenotrophomonas]MBC9079702.1 response regulator transcription factor [Stenotrophomonas maltophilia]MBC9091239.1 response regulator transcription factor [Stenotrophomonas maltophilia]MBH1519053.1 response regulator transcription factor [Stenotrophomonas maltophilia]MBN4940753.1 response regulator transcription factor [Stenotrophomonas maltophilia]MBN5058299.1 response regulator transcription factor [Stenotrophomonas maltophilia]
MNGFPAPRRLRLALLDDHEVVRRGTALHLSGDLRFDIVASHGCSSDLIHSLRCTPVDVAVIDLTLARGDLCSIELVSLLCRDFPRTSLLAFATLSPTTNLNSLIDAGLHGFVSKAEPLTALSDAIVRVSQGLLRVPPDVRLAGDRGELSRNEREVLGLLLQGLTVSEIALRRHRSIKTVSTQKVAVLRKLGLRSDVEIYALRERMESP